MILVCIFGLGFIVFLASVATGGLSFVYLFVRLSVTPQALSGLKSALSGLKSPLSGLESGFQAREGRF